eukprot:2645044-Pleurochrysis_carterae.AAC.2
MEHVFTKYSFPLVIKSDNGTVFRNELMACVSKDAGFRNAYVLPNNVQGNGTADQSVGRITRPLVRHTQQFANWPSTLPIKGRTPICLRLRKQGMSLWICLHYDYDRHGQLCGTYIYVNSCGCGSQKGLELQKMGRLTVK